MGREVVVSLSKAILHNKERRREYRGARAIASSCRHQGSCSYCERNRRIAERRLNASARLRSQPEDQP